MIPLLITIDTEGDNLWARPQTITTRNARFLPRFQQLCERHRLKPTYLTNYEMAKDPAFREFALDAIRRQAAEVGMHLHAWNSPPLTRLTPDDDHFQPFLIEYPEEQMREKIAFMTHQLEDSFQVPMVSHRAGRWALDSRYARLLIQYGYRVDCSVTPNVSWRRTRGAPQGTGGVDYSRFPARPYFVNLDDLSRAGNSSLLEVPMSVSAAGWRYRLWRLGEFHSLTSRVGRRILRPIQWFRPNGSNQEELLAMLERYRDAGATHLEFMLHSSEFMPGGSPTFGTADSIEALYDTLEAVFAAATAGFVGMTLAEFDQKIRVADRA